MILIDKRKSEHRLIVTVSECTIGVPIIYKLNLHSTYTNKSYSILLPENTSSYPSRFDEFIVDASFTLGWEVGSYAYTIVQSDGENDIAVVETGVLKVIDGTQQWTETPSLPSSGEEEFIVFEN